MSTTTSAVVPDDSVERFTKPDELFPMNEAIFEGNTRPFASVVRFGTSAWTNTGKITVLGQDGTEKAYFIKVAEGEHAGVILNGEWESSKKIYELMPDFIPEPLGCGRFKTNNPACYFYLCEFVNMNITTAPDPNEFASRLAAMHRSSQSPTGKFGFHTTTGDGKARHTVDWQHSWADFYRTLFLNVCKLDRETNGIWPELERAIELVAYKQDGRSIKPCIIHGDLWDGNSGINVATGKTVLFDAGSYYAHNEMELGHWRCEFSSIFRDPVYIQSYLQHYPAAEPADEYDDRNRLYSIKGTMNYSAGHPGSSLRRTAYNDMCYLCEKYASTEGIDEYDPLLDPSLTGARIVPHSEEGATF
ncbi:hypothetical protein K491DRAFT_703919 [Lophiostoma macrostomum CBS 122681]|uniref:protein-ribulosamine 3-kinase n=1 Tax=Lophiostoma macrostomum CBS 122681 TaxID=1314788 RepID=A0A6A6T9F7_9PLEO|nr:hypothetical protein K491DRAFT_703919 [Lophiostoma macrostomum CBS 122681]